MLWRWNNVYAVHNKCSLHYSCQRGIIKMSVGVPPMGCSNLCLSVGRRNWRVCAVFMRRKIKTPDQGSGGFVEYPIHDTILRIVANLLTTKFFGGFLIQKKQELENEIKNHHYWRNILRCNHHQRPRCNKMRCIEQQQYDMYIRCFTKHRAPRMGCDVHHKWGKHTDKWHRRMQQ